MKTGTYFCWCWYLVVFICKQQQQGCKAICLQITVFNTGLITQLKNAVTNYLHLCVWQKYVLLPFPHIPSLLAQHVLFWDVPPEFCSTKNALKQITQYFTWGLRAKYLLLKICHLSLAAVRFTRSFWNMVSKLTPLFWHCRPCRAHGCSAHVSRCSFSTFKTCVCCILHISMHNYTWCIFWQISGCIKQDKSHDRFCVLIPMVNFLPRSHRCFCHLGLSVTVGVATGFACHTAGSKIFWSFF